MHNKQRYYLEGQYRGSDVTFKITLNGYPVAPFAIEYSDRENAHCATLLQCLQDARQRGTFEVISICDRLAMDIIESLNNFS